MKDIKLGITYGSKVSSRSPYLLGGTVCQAMARAEELGYDGIELHIRDLSEVDSGAVSEYRKSGNAKIAAISTGSIAYQQKLYLNDKDEVRRQMAIEAARKYIEMSSRLECDLIFANVRGNIPEGMSMEESEARYADSLMILSEDAKKHQVKMLIELTNRYEANYLNCVSQGVAFLEKYQIPMAKLHLDTFHMNMEERCIEDAIREAQDYMGYLHIADNNRYPMGYGHISFQKVFHAVKETGYKGYVTVECLPYPDGSTASEKSIRMMKALADLYDL